jgi:hypothetical protein
MGLHKLLFFLATLLFGTHGFAAEITGSGAPKDTLLLMNGSRIAGDVIDTANRKFKVKYLKKSGREKVISMEDDLVFSVRYQDGHEQIVYQQDTSTGNYFSAEETRFFIYGEQDAEKGYRCPGSTISSFMIGVGSAYIGSFLSLIPPFAYSGLMLIPKIVIKYKTVSNPVYLNYDTYVMGYEKVARRKKLFRSLVSGIGGLAGGLVSFQLLFPKL